MTNLEIIKYLSINNPTRLAELLDDIYCNDWNCGSCAGSTGKIMEECEIDDFGEWINQEANTNFFFENELEEWSNAINNPSIEITYPDNLVIQLPYEGKDFNHMWNTDNNFNIISNAIGEINLLETLVNVDKYTDSVYNSFRKEVCAGCNDPNCLKSQVEIYDCHKFKSYFEV